MNIDPTNLLHPLKLTVLSVKEEDHDYHFHVEAPEPRCCEACGVIDNWVKSGKEDQSYRDVPIHHKRVTIWLIRRRYKCNACGGTFRPHLAEMDDRRMMTKRLSSYVEKAASMGSNSDVAREVGIEEKTVRSIFMDYYTAKNALYKVTAPRVLGIDELYVGRDGYYGIFTNISESTVIELLPNRYKSTVVNFLSNLPKHKDIEIVCTDMWAPYRDSVKAILPQAKLVIDKFHVLKMANDAMEVIRKGLKADLNVAQRKTLKGDRKLLLMREHDLRPWQHLTMETWLNAFPELNVAYQLKEGFFGIWNATDEKDARERYIKWKSEIPASQKLAWKTLNTSMTNWEEHIFAYFSTGKQYTNALTESRNREVKDKRRDARGMSFESYRAKILFSQEHKVVKPKPRKSSPFEGFSRMSLAGLFNDDDYKSIDYGVPISTVLRLIEAGEL